MKTATFNCLDAVSYPRSFRLKCIFGQNGTLAGLDAVSYPRSFRPMTSIVLSCFAGMSRCG